MPKSVGPRRLIRRLCWAALGLSLMATGACGGGRNTADPGSAPACGLAFDPGPCNAFFPVFSYVGGACVERVWGGCEGNDNRFRTLEQCLAACEGRPGSQGCPEGRVPKNICLSCGPAGGCGESAQVCAKTCVVTSECAGSLPFCSDGVCQMVGCI